jgi:hypothetical protein
LGRVRVWVRVRVRDRDRDWVRVIGFGFGLGLGLESELCQPYNLDEQLGHGRVATDGLRGATLTRYGTGVYLRY